jgi:hypothetical protein
MERIHIVGVGPRTGTTLLAECMAACFEIDAVEAHEAPLTRHRSGVEVYLTKRPLDLAFVGPRLRTDRHFHVLCMLRDPRDAVVSRHASDETRYWTPLGLWKWQLAQARRLQLRPRFLLLRYEDLVSDPDSVQRAVVQRLPFLRQRALFSEFHKVAAPSAKSVAALGGVRPISESRVGNWRQHLPRLAGQIKLFGPIGPDLVDLGYETDEAWTEELAGVEPDLSESHWSATDRATKRNFRRQRRKAALDAIRILGARAFGRRLV